MKSIGYEQESEVLEVVAGCTFDGNISGVSRRRAVDEIGIVEIRS